LYPLPLFCVLTNPPTMAIELLQVDAFAERPFEGNPAAVCVLDSAADEYWMQLVAREMNLSETAFVHPSGEGRWNLRWFTPSTEVDLCGHATLAAGHVLWELGRARLDETIHFDTLSGPLENRRAGDFIEMDFPAEEAFEARIPDELVEALGMVPVWAGRNRMDYLLELEDEQALRRLRPDMKLLGRIRTRGVIVTARSYGQNDFVSRFFGPAVGVAEDPVTGSAHCALGPYWSGKLGKQQVVGYQASERGGTVCVSHQGERVIISGKAVTVIRGTLYG
jgi:PhzF family phenazine biosynthesis protein